jgi:Transposase IS66 family
VRRVVNGVEAYIYLCSQCGKDSFPEQYTNRAKYGHSLKAWAMYEHIAHRSSFENIEETFRDLFKLPVCFRHIHVFKSIMVNYYRETYEFILKKLIAGAILHADETEVHI